MEHFVRDVIHFIYISNTFFYKIFVMAWILRQEPCDAEAERRRIRKNKDTVRDKPNLQSHWEILGSSSSMSVVAILSRWKVSPN